MKVLGSIGYGNFVNILKALLLEFERFLLPLTLELA